MKVRISLNNDSGYWCDLVNVIIDLPVMPRVGEYIVLSESSENELERLINLHGKQDDYHNYYFESKIEGRHFSIDDGGEVIAILYKENDEIPCIVI